MHYYAIIQFIWRNIYEYNVDILLFFYEHYSKILKTQITFLLFIFINNINIEF